MDCDHEGCEKLGCASTTKWLDSGGMLVKYWCKEHAPEHAEYFCWARVIVDGKGCEDCELEKG